MLIFDLAKSGYRRMIGKPVSGIRTEGKNRREYGSGASVSIGVVHGIGAETGSQALLLASAAGATSALTGSILLIAFVVGLIVSNTLITIASTAGLVGTRRHHALYTLFGIIVAIFSLALGSMFVFGAAANLPALLI
jgi:high-affinity nickel-transport protein